MSRVWGLIKDTLGASNSSSSVWRVERFNWLCCDSLKGKKTPGILRRIWRLWGLRSPEDSNKFKINWGKCNKDPPSWLSLPSWDFKTRIWRDFSSGFRRTTGTWHLANYPLTVVTRWPCNVSFMAANSLNWPFMCVGVKATRHELALVRRSGLELQRSREKSLAVARRLKTRLYQAKRGRGRGRGRTKTAQNLWHEHEFSHVVTSGVPLADTVAVAEAQTQAQPAIQRIHL